MNEDQRSLGSARAATARSARSTGRKLRTAHLSAKHLQLVTEHQDLDVLGAFASRSCERASQRAGDEGEDEQHPRMLRRLV